MTRGDKNYHASFCVYERSGRARIYIQGGEGDAYDVSVAKGIFTSHCQLGWAFSKLETDGRLLNVETEYSSQLYKKLSCC